VLPSKSGVSGTVAAAGSGVGAARALRETGTETGADTGGKAAAWLSDADEGLTAFQSNGGQALLRKRQIDRVMRS